MGESDSIRDLDSLLSGRGLIYKRQRLQDQRIFNTIDEKKNIKYKNVKI